jgi:hypothetical protein
MNKYLDSYGYARAYIRRILWLELRIEGDTAIIHIMRTPVFYGIGGVGERERKRWIGRREAPTDGNRAGEKGIHMCIHVCV